MVPSCNRACKHVIVIVVQRVEDGVMEHRSEMQGLQRVIVVWTELSQ